MMSPGAETPVTRSPKGGGRVPADGACHNRAAAGGNRVDLFADAGASIRPSVCGSCSRPAALRQRARRRARPGRRDRDTRVAVAEGCGAVSMPPPILQDRGQRHRDAAADASAPSGAPRIRAGREYARRTSRARCRNRSGARGDQTASSRQPGSPRPPPFQSRDVDNLVQRGLDGWQSTPTWSPEAALPSRGLERVA